MDPEHAPEVARIFAESDAGGLPHLLGVKERILFRFHDLYFHLIESEPGIAENLQRVRTGKLFQDVDHALKPLVLAYDPDTWRGPQDAMATPFYSWQVHG
jgi:cyclase